MAIHTIIQQTREELRLALENEMRAFLVDRELGQTTQISWNHVEFEVRIVIIQSTPANPDIEGTE